MCIKAGGLEEIRDDPQVVVLSDWANNSHLLRGVTLGKSRFGAGNGINSSVLAC